MVVIVHFQTSGRERAATIGDWYTTASSSSTSRFHRFDIVITQDQLDAAGGSLDLSVNDAESYGALDEVGGTSGGTTSPDPTRFTLRSSGATAPGSGGTLLKQQTFSGGPNGQTFSYTFTSPGTYVLFSETGAYPISGNATTALNNDDNTFSITVGTGDFSPVVGAYQSSIQATAQTTFDAYYYVPAGTPGPLRMRNFDLDAGGTVSYLRPDGSMVAGTASLDGVWNGGGSLNTGFDSVPLAATGGAAQYGWWRVRVSNWTSGNQTIFEAQDGNGNILPLVYAAPTNLNLTKTVNTATPVVGEVITYTITLTNSGSSGVTGIKVSDVLPGGLSYVSSSVTVPSNSAGSYDPATGLWHIRNLSAGAQATLEIKAKVTDTGAATNTASVTGADQPLTSFASASAVTTAYPSSLTLSKIVNTAFVKYQGSPAVPSVGTLTYTVTVNNAGPVSAYNVNVTDLLPKDLTNPVVKEGSVTLTPSVTTTPTGNQQLSWALGTVAASTTRTFTVTVDVPAASILSGSQPYSAWVNSATVTSSNQAEKSASATTQSIYVTLKKRVRNRGPQGTLNSAFSDTSGSGLPGDRLEYCIDAQNLGSVPLNNFNITDYVPGNTTYVSSSASLSGSSNLPTFDGSVTAWDQDHDPTTPAVPVSGLVTGPVGTLAAGTSATLCFQAKIQ